jgi:pilus assembly protein CpaB
VKIRIVLLLLAVIFGVAAVIGVMIYLNNVRSSIEAEGETVNVVVASENIVVETKVSAMVSEKMIEIKEIPKKFLVENALDSLQGYEDYVAKVAIIKGEQLTAAKFGKIEEIRISFTVPEDFIAVSVPYNEIKGVSNLIKVGDKVNVIGTFQPSKDDLVLFNKDMVTQMLLQLKEDDSQAETESGLPSSDFLSMDSIMDESNYLVFPVTKILLWNIEVLYIGSMKETALDTEEGNSGITSSSSSKDKEETKTVTLALTPEQAEMLVFTEELGSVWLALVPAGGIDEQETPGRTYLNIIE